MRDILNSIQDAIDEAYFEADALLNDTELDVYEEIMRCLEDAGINVSDCIDKLTRS